jgi:hypothetical protein
MRTLRFLPILVGLTLAASLPSSTASALQAPVVWSPPERVPEYHDLLRAPLMTVDNNGTVHAFDIEVDDQVQYVLMHRRWTPESGWSSPTDVVLPEYLGIAPSLQAVVIDKRDRIHLVYHGGDPQGQSVYYTTAEASRADAALAWSDPAPVGTYAAGVAAASVTANADGELVLLYGGNRLGEGLYATVSRDQGASWSEPVLLERVEGEELWPADVTVVSDDEGRFHVVWGTVDQRGLSEVVRYARLEADLSSWGHTAVLARMDNELELVGAPGIVASPDGLVVAYEDGYPPTKYIRRSADFGESWTMPVRPFPHIGAYGRPALVTDSAGNVHLIVGNRLPSPETYGMWYSQLVGEHWLPLQALSSGPGAPDFGPCCGQAVMVGGNLLLAAWAHNVSRDFLTGAWSSYARLDIPTQAPESSAGAPGTIERQTPSVTTIVRSSSTPIPPAASDASAASVDVPTPALDSAGPLRIALPIYVGIVPVTLLAAYLIFRRVGRPAAALGEDGDGKGIGDSPGPEHDG